MIASLFKVSFLAVVSGGCQTMVSMCSLIGQWSLGAVLVIVCNLAMLL